MPLKIIAILLLLPCLVSAQGGIAADKGRLYFTGAEGDVLFEDLTLNNPTETPLHLQVFYGDWKRDSTGVKQYSLPGTLAHSCSEWLSVSPQVITVPATEKVTVRVRMEVPADYAAEEGVKNSMIYFRQMKAAKRSHVSADGVRSEINVLFQLGVHAYFSPASLQQKAIALQSMTTDSLTRVTVGLENTGQTLLTASIRLELTDLATGNEINVLPKPLLVPFMPQDFRYVRLDLPADLPPGRYSALVITDIGPEHDLELGILEFGEMRRPAKRVAAQSN